MFILHKALNSISEKDFNTLLDPVLFSAILDTLGEAIWVTDFRKPALYWFASAENQQKYGIPTGHIDNDFWISNIHPEDRERVVTGFERALHDPSVSIYNHEYRFLGANGTVYVIYDNMRFLRNAKGEAERVIGTWRDVTSRYERDQKMQELMANLEVERNRFKMIAELANTAMWEVDVRSKTLKWTAGNKTLEEFGFNNPGYTLDDWLQDIHIDDRERVAANFDHAIASGDNFFDTYRFLKKDGTIVHVIDQGTIVRDEAGQALKAVGSWVDITRERTREEILERSLEQQRALNRELQVREEELAMVEEELRQSNDQLSHHVQQLSEREFILNQSQRLARIGSWGYESDTKAVFWSNEMYNIFGVDEKFNVNDPEEVISLFDEPGRALIRDAFQRMALNYEPFDITGRITTPLGYKKWVRITAYPVLRHMFHRVVGLVFDITYLKEAEERLKSSEQKFSIAFRNNPNLMAIMRESDNLIADVNDRVESVLGYTRQEVIGLPASALTLFANPDDREEFNKRYFENNVVEMECPWYRKDGSIIHVIISSNRVEIEGVPYILSVVRDVSERRNAEERFRKSFDLNPDLMLVFRERDLMLMEVNEKLQAIAGYSREDVIGKSSSSFNIWAIPQDRNKYFETLAREGSVSMESVFIRKNGAHFFGTISAQRIQLHGENHLLVIIRDTTEKRIIEEKLVKSEANLHSILNNTEYFIWSVDMRNKLLRFNNRFAGFFKRYLKTDLFVNMPILDFINPPEFSEFWRHKYELAKNGSTTTFDVETNDRIYHCVLHPIFIEGKISGITAYMNDITSQREAEERLMLSEANLHATINNTKFMVWAVDRQYRLITCNQTFKEYMKHLYDSELVYGQPIIAQNSTHPEANWLRTTWNECYERALTGESFVTQEKRNNRYHKYSFSPIKGKDSITGITVFAEDITEQKLAEDKIRENETKLHAIINNTDLSIWSVDLDYRITTLNQVFYQTMKDQYNVAYTVGQDMIEASRGYLPDYLIDYWIGIYNRVFTGESVLEEYKGEHTITQISVHPIVENQRVVGASIYTRDITDLKHKAEELAEANRKIGELKLMALRSVMNPHFIFNALNSIQYFIAKNDRQNAINYLSTFSKLIRGVLTHSVNDKISIADEIALLHYYINLEMVRFENKFEFQLEIDPELDQESIEIPSLLIQPYVENAILHGLYSKQGKGLLKITVRYDQDRVLFTVEDNGIGRAAAKELRSKNFPKHNSMGTVLTEERLRLINERDNVAFEIQDLVTEDGEPQGTRVNIWVRF
ncbi:PAS domain S-box protein [Ohtaekwangia sp.]|uniref:PAS domain S-box protein n=1 Tax=Ohtaekwangia sp. TaxID=2066019 RepID=UPI002FDE78FB